MGLKYHAGMKLHGAEIEKTIAAEETGQPFRVGPAYFERLRAAAEARGTFVEVHHGDLDPKGCIGVMSSDLGEQGLDNGYGLLETALPPLPTLDVLYERQLLDLNTVQEALAAEGASTLNMAIHPLGRRDFDSYREQVAPKGIYRYIWYRGWDHTSGMDGRSQNSPSTSVDVDEAAMAVSVVIGAGAAFIGLCANSPFEEGRVSGAKETRLLMWERMFGGSRAKSDLEKAKFPTQPFQSLGDYFHWMFGPGTNMHFAHASSTQDYRGIGASLIIVEGNPGLLEFLSRAEWRGYRFDDLMTNFPPRETVRVAPSLRHLELLQWAQFTGARVRFQLDRHEEIPAAEFAAACRGDGSRDVEKMLAPYVKAMWIEGRDPGANFPDRELLDIDEQAARSIIIAPSALQAGLLRNLSAASQFLHSHDWNDLAALRAAAIRDGLDGRVGNLSVRAFTERILEIAAQGLLRAEHKFLAYFEYVLRTGKNGADRQLAWLDRYHSGSLSGLPELVKSRVAVPASVK
ncbi:MAG: hypothetical protein K1X79_09265 [Oligoflexia bacterium]|nr:hypothetical protein [Oligoflexia bacterium]